MLTYWSSDTPFKRVFLDEAGSFEMPNHKYDRLGNTSMHH